MKVSLAKHEAFWEQITSGKLKTNAIKVYEALKKCPNNIYNLRQELSMAHQTLTATLSLLEDTGWVVKSSIIKINGKSFTTFEAVTDIDTARKNAENIQIYKKDKWIKLGKKMGWIVNNTLDGLI